MKSATTTSIPTTSSGSSSSSSSNSAAKNQGTNATFGTATRTSLYSFQDHIIEISISVDALGPLHRPDDPLTDEEREKYGLMAGNNPWAHLGVPDFAIEKPPPAPHRPPSQPCMSSKHSSEDTLGHHHDGSDHVHGQTLRSDTKRKRSGSGSDRSEDSGASHLSEKSMANSLDILTEMIGTNSNFVGRPNVEASSHADTSGMIPGQTQTQQPQPRQTGQSFPSSSSSSSSSSMPPPTAPGYLGIHHGGGFGPPPPPPRINMLIRLLRRRTTTEGCCWTMRTT